MLPADTPTRSDSVRDLCLLGMDRRRLAEAEALADEYEHGIRCAWGPKHPDNVSALANRGLIRLLQGKPDEAEPFYRQAADEARRILGPEHPIALAAASRPRPRAAGAGSPRRSRTSSRGTLLPLIAL